MKIREEMTIGPKGQVVIPKMFRKYTGLQPGSKVVIELVDHGLTLEKPRRDVVDSMRRIAHMGKQVKISPHEYEEELELRWKKSGK